MAGGIRLHGCGAILLLAVFGAALAAPADAQQMKSRLYDVTKAKVLRVCDYPGYYSISYRDPKSGELVGLDADLARELAKELDAELRFVDTSFGTFIADLQADKCDIGMFAVAATLKRAQAVTFSKPYLATSIYGVTRASGPLKAWADLDRPGVRAAVSLGGVIDSFMSSYLKKAELSRIAPPASREAELLSRRVDVIFTDYPAAVKIQSEYDWAQIVDPTEKLALTPYAYVVQAGDQIWLNYVNLFVDTIKLDGRLARYAEKHKLGPILLP